MLSVGNLSSDKVSKRDVYDLFHVFGRLAQISLKSAYGFVQYHTVDEGNRAIQAMEGAEIKGRRIRKLNTAVISGIDQLTLNDVKILKSPNYKRKPRKSVAEAPIKVVGVATGAAAMKSMAISIAMTIGHGTIPRVAMSSTMTPVSTSVNASAIEVATTVDGTETGLAPPAMDETAEITGGEVLVPMGGVARTVTSIFPDDMEQMSLTSKSFYSLMLVAILRHG